MNKILFICGSLNQTTMMHKISMHLSNSYDCRFTHYYADGLVKLMSDRGYLNFCIIGSNYKIRTEEYCKTHNLQMDDRGELNDYDLVVTCSDLIIPKNIKNKKVILVQEGMTDPKNIFYYGAKYLKLPRYFASTSTTGLSDYYDYFCVASKGYKELFTSNGCNPDKIIVTGIPNFDNCRQYLNNDFPHKDYVLVCTSDARETFKYENRKYFIKRAVEIANGRKLIFKLHPNEKAGRANYEIQKYAEGALVYASGNTNEMIANCSVLITKYSSVVYVGLALGKEVFSDFDMDILKSLVPEQNDGHSSFFIANLCDEHINCDKKIIIN